MVKKVDRESMSFKFRKLDDSPGNHMKQVVKKWGKALEGLLEGMDTTATQVELLAAVANLTKDGDPVTQQDVAGFTGRDKNTVSDVLRTLEKKSYLTRSTREGNMRSKYLVLTDKGFGLVERALGEALRIDERFFPDDDDTRELKRLLKKYLQ
jgi:DNA-binding MarR family transcriptional regulator